MHARWTACSLAAAVLLCGSRGLADGVLVHIDSPVPAQIAETRHHVGASGRKFWAYSEMLPVCSSPCDRLLYLDANRHYVITGQFPESPTLDASDLTGSMTITVEPGSESGLTSGLFLTPFGSLFFAGGVSMAVIASTSGDRDLTKVGIGAIVGGGVTAIIGVVLLATFGTKIKLQQTGFMPVGNAAPVKPRYWMGEF